MSNKPWVFIKHMTDYLQRERLGDPKIPTLWPSEGSAVTLDADGNQEVLGKCRRSTFFRFFKDWVHFNPALLDNPKDKQLMDLLDSATLPVDPYLVWIWQAGNLYEQHCIDLAKDSGVFIADQVPLTIKREGCFVSGKIDLITINPDTGGRIICEIKSVFGYGADVVMGDPKTRTSGTPRDSNLIQIAIYQSHFGNQRDEFEPAHLVYGARDTGRYAEYLIEVEGDNIFYTQIAPFVGKRTESLLKINSIYECYDYVYQAFASLVVPPRDFDIQYSDEKILEMYKAGELTKMESQRVARREEQIAEGANKINKQIEKGSFQCSRCQYKNICYDDKNQPREVCD